MGEKRSDKGGGKIKSGRQKRGTGGGLIQRQTDDGGEGLGGTSKASPADGVGERSSSSSSDKLSGCEKFGHISFISHHTLNLIFFFILK